MKYCSTCGRAHALKEQYCAADGTRLDQTVRPIRFEQAAQFCVDCGHQQNSSASYCPNCGHSRMIAATSELTLVDRLKREAIRPGVDGMKNKWKGQDWNGLPSGLKEKTATLLSRFDFSLSNPNLVVGSTTGLIFIGMLLVSVFVALALLGDEEYSNYMTTVYDQYGEEIGYFGQLFFTAFFALSGLQLSMGDEIKARFKSEVLRNATSSEASVVREAVDQIGLSLKAGHFMLSFVGLALLVVTALLLERGGVTGGRAANWTERFERIAALTATVALFALLAGLFATDFGMFDLHVIGGTLRTILFMGVALSAFMLLVSAPRLPLLRAAHTGLSVAIGTYLILLVLTAFGQLAFFELMEDEGVEVPASSQVSVVLFNGASPLYVVSQGGSIALEATAMNEAYEMNLALYGEDRLSDIQATVEEASEVSGSTLDPDELFARIEAGRSLNLGNAVTHYDETIDLSVIARAAEVADKKLYADQDEIDELLNSSVAPYGLLLLLVFGLFHVLAGVRHLNGWRQAAVYSAVTAGFGLFVAFFTHASLRLTWDGEVMGDITMTGLSFLNVVLMFLFAFVLATGGSFLNQNER